MTQAVAERKMGVEIAPINDIMRTLGYRRKVLIEPAHSNKVNPDGSPNNQLYISCVGSCFDKGTGITHMIVKGMSAGRQSQASESDITATFGRGANVELYYAVSPDHGKTVSFIGPDGQPLPNEEKWKAQPVFTSSDTKRRATYGLQDPRITVLRGPENEQLILVTANALNKDEFRATVGTGGGGRDPSQPIKGEYAELFLVESFTDIKSFKSLGFLGPSDQYFKNVVVHPEIVTINGDQCVLLYTRKLPSIQLYPIRLADFTQLLQDEQFREKYWQIHLQPDLVESCTILRPIFSWEGVCQNNPDGQIAAGPPPIEVSYLDPYTNSEVRAWLFIYNAVPYFHKNKEPRGRVIGAALLDYDNPWKVLARSPQPIIVPETPAETTEGRAQDVVFSTGAHISDKGQEKILNIIYTQGDKNAATFSGPLVNMLGYLSQYDANGQLKLY